MARETIKELKAQLAKARKHEKALRADIELRDELIAVQRAKIVESKGRGVAWESMYEPIRDCLLECLGLEHSDETLVELAIQVRDGWHEMEKGVTAGMDYVTGQDHAKAMAEELERHQKTVHKVEDQLIAAKAERDAAFHELGRLYIEQRNAERRQ
ncbi:MAG: hypothetical protein ACYTBJ_21735 [Planctomycetota bacterium]|jgi:hypothetical protein